MQGNYIAPIIGQVYANRNGREYCCLSNTAYPSDEAMQKAVALGLAYLALRFRTMYGML